jgi:hypothetical protein
MGTNEKVVLVFLILKAPPSAGHLALVKHYPVRIQTPTVRFRTVLQASGAESHAHKGVLLGTVVVVLRRKAKLP